jgi:hypothetical protein
MTDLLSDDTDFEISKYYEARDMIDAGINPAIEKNKKSVFNPETNMNDVLLPMSSGGYVKISEEAPEVMAEAPAQPTMPGASDVAPAQAAAEEAKRLQEIQGSYTLDDLRAAGYTDEQISAAGLDVQPTMPESRTEPLSEQEVADIIASGQPIITADPTLRQEGSRVVSTYFFDLAVQGLREDLAEQGMGADEIERTVKAREGELLRNAEVYSNALFGTGATGYEVGVGDFATAGIMDIQEGYRMFQQQSGEGGTVGGRAIGMAIMAAGVAEATGVGYAFGKLLKRGAKALEPTLVRMGEEAQGRIDAEGATLFSNPVGPAVDRGLAAAGRLAGNEAPSATTPNQAGSAIKLYHGTDAPEFEQFDPSQARTAKHIYTSPIRDDAAAYGRNVLEFETDANILDLRADTRGVNETKVLRQAYDDGGLDDYFDSFDDFVDAFDNGDMYQRFGSQNAQNAVIDELFAASGADGLRIPDAGFGGALSESVVFEDPSKLQKVTEEAKPSAAELRRQANIQRFGYDPNDPVAEVKAPTEAEPGIIAFHGSGADFDEFKLEKIGTGEGNQAFGYGLYFTEKEDIAKFYRDSVGAGNEVTYKGKVIQDLDQDFADENNIAHMAGQQETPEDMQRVVADEVRRTRNNLAGIEQSIKDFQQNPDVYPLKFHGMEISMETAEKQREFLQRRLDAALEVQDNIGQIETKPAGTMYQVGLHVNSDELIDYDKTFDEQSPFVQQAILKVLNEIHIDDAVNMGFDVFSPPYNGNEEMALQATRQAMLDNFAVVRFLNDWSVLRGAENSGEELLEKHGVKGIKYKAQRGVGARNVPETGADNYVIFDDKLINIMKKYGIVGPVAVTAMKSEEQEET